ncbi:MAG: hypothetical protein HVK41_03570 [Pelagibacteraceae bacterium]|jgi:hypothetical protein|nr:hypothetical protein [Pelagibacteraceae bacterium]HJO13159.1 hypothetical protein [Alphaproteobacteria bacterium]MBO6467393.1 hypothetical protein [Pelagibacteraceae bacterium]MBO6470083.1 hypothetical protein [Pelagibacteraceae bacterium]MBO6471625.1 hypothetical protein [Pelagibacteraceae bacterium]
MKYFTAIATLLGLNLISVITLIYFSGISKEIEKENKILEMQISKFSKQLKINKVEFTLHSRPSYLKKLQKIYFDTDNVDSFENTRIKLIDFEKKDLRNIYMVSSN